MIWLRKGAVHLLSLILFVTLLGTALTTGANMAFSHPDKIETWLSQSGLYSHFVDEVTTQAQKSTGGNNSSVALTDVAVQQAAKSSFTPQLLQQDVNTFLNSNYAWLEGKTSVPNFSIDLGPTKQTFAQTVGSYVTTYLSGLPVCTPAQLAQLGNSQSVDPLSLSCRPAVLNPQTEGTQITQQLASSGDFLSNPVLTANNLNPSPKNGQNQQPYYQKFSSAPKAYRAAIHLPLVLVIIALLSALGILFMAVTRRRGERRIGVVLLVVGILLVLIKFGADKAFKQVEDKIFNSSNIGQLQQSLTDFAHRVESQLVKIDLLFGIVFLLIAVIILGSLFATRQRQPKSSNAEKLPLPADKGAAPDQSATGNDKPAARPKPPQLVQ